MTSSPAGYGDEDQPILRLRGCIVYRHRHHRNVLSEWRKSPTDLCFDQAQTSQRKFHYIEGHRWHVVLDDDKEVIGIACTEVPASSSVNYDLHSHSHVKSDNSHLLHRRGAQKKDKEQDDGERVGAMTKWCTLVRPSFYSSQGDTLS